jgi:hypothetical protein
MAFRHDQSITRRNPAYLLRPRAPEPDRNLIILRVSPENEMATRGLLHQATGTSIEHYTIEHSPHTQRCTFTIKTKSGCVDFLMHQIMSHLPEAEFGKIVGDPTALIIQ